MVLGENAIETAASRLFEAQRSRVACEPIRGRFDEGDLSAAYSVQQLNTKRALDAGRILAGRKIGLTSKAVQRQMGVDQPDYGMLFADMAVPDGWEISRDRLIQPKAEGEVAFVLGRDLISEQITMADVVRAVDYVLPAIEVVDSRIVDWNIGIVDTIADNASSGLYVLGNDPRRLEGVDLRLCGMVMEVGGEPVSTGAGLACLGHPLNAVWWLARIMAEMGSPLKEGDTVLSGALGPMVTVKWGTVVEARINGLGSVRAAFAKK